MVVLGSVGVVLVVGYVLGMIYFPGATKDLMWLVPTSFFAVGKFLPLFGISGQIELGPYQLGLVIWAMDTFTVLMIVYALEGVYWIRPLKRWLDRIQANAILVLDAFPRMRKMAIAGLVLFVLFPIAGTGAIGGAFIGVLLGLHRVRLIAAISAGGLIGGMLMAFLAANFASALRDVQALQEDPSLQYLIVGAVVLALAIGVIALTRAYRRALEDARRKPEKAT
jgi:uncharacterized membrane protein